QTLSRSPAVRALHRRRGHTRLNEQVAETMAASAYEVRRVLKIYDDASIAPVGRAISMLTEVTKSIATAPGKHDLLSEDAEVWAEGGGNSYGENAEFPTLVGARWVEILSKDGVLSAAGLDKEEWRALLQALTDYEAKLSAAKLSLEALDELTEIITKLREQAPEPEDDSDDDDNSDESD
ncbi:hypothetical protein TSOC_001002, partial [Tetrabaena socialis]